MEDIGSESRKDLKRGGETGSRTRISVAEFGSRRRIIGKPIGFAKRALSEKGIVALTWPLLLNAQETRLGAITRVAFIRHAGIRKGVSGSVMCITALSTNDNRSGIRTAACQVTQPMALGILKQDGVVFENRRTSNLTKKGGGIAKDKVEFRL